MPRWRRGYTGDCVGAGLIRAHWAGLVASGRGLYGALGWGGACRVMPLVAVPKKATRGAPHMVIDKTKLDPCYVHPAWSPGKGRVWSEDTLSPLCSLCRVQEAPSESPMDPGFAMCLS